MPKSTPAGHLPRVQAESKLREMTTETAVVEPGLYGDLDVLAGKPLEHTDASTWYTSRAASEDILLKACELFAVTRFQLGRLLGCPQTNRVYQWLSGEKRPSSKYALRLAKLLQLHMAGVPLASFDYIDWNTGNGFKGSMTDAQSGGYIPQTRRRRVPDQQGTPGPDVSGIPAQQHSAPAPLP